jgi:hypothetical protein
MVGDPEPDVRHLVSDPSLAPCHFPWSISWKLTVRRALLR